VRQQHPFLGSYRRNHAYYSTKEKAPPKFRYEQMPNGSVREVAYL
jgi:hypothetical protein